MKLKLLCLSVNGTLHDSGTIFKLPKRHDYWKRLMNHIPELPKGDSLLVYKGVNINTAYHSLSGAALYIVKQITEL